MRRLAVWLVASCLVLALTAPPALAGDEGQVVTGAGFVLIAFFPLFVALMSAIQWRLEKRKEQHRKAERARRSRPEWRGGW